MWITWIFPFLAIFFTGAFKGKYPGSSYGDEDQLIKRWMPVPQSPLFTRQIVLPAIRTDFFFCSYKQGSSARSWAKRCLKKLTKMKKARFG